MKRLIKIRLGVDKRHSGLLPVKALDLIQDLLSAIKEEGGTAEDWDAVNAHVEIIGEASTELAVYSDRVASLRRPTKKFVNKAKKRRLTPKGRGFAIEHFKGDSAWTYCEVITGDSKPARVQFDPEYREDVLAARSEIRGIDELYVRVSRVGGDPPTAQLEIPGHPKRTYKVASKELAREMASMLYETVKISAEVVWEPDTFNIQELVVTGLDKEWRDVHLGQVIAENSGRLPLELSLSSTEELLRKRQRERRNN